MLTRLLAVVISFTVVIAPCLVAAEPSTLPTGKFQLVPPGEVHTLGTQAWCYDDQANAALVLAADNERNLCKLKLEYAVEQENLRSKLIIDNLKLRVDTVKTEYQEIVKIKDKEIESLTEIATSLPDSYSGWWATGGFVAGLLVTLAITYTVTK